MDHDKWLEQHDRMIADHDRELAEIREEHRRFATDVRRGGRLLFREAVRHRRRMRELDEKLTQLASAQLITEEKLQRLIERDERRYGGNGNAPAA